MTCYVRILLFRTKKDLPYPIFSGKIALNCHIVFIFFHLVWLYLKKKVKSRQWVIFFELYVLFLFLFLCLKTKQL